MSNPTLILASTSPYRKRLLEQLSIPFTQVNPVTDETPIEGEQPRDLALRLGSLKGQSVAAPLISGTGTGDVWIVLGSDQVCHLQDRIYGKPGNIDLARDHLKQFSGNWVTFSTSLALISSTGSTFCQVEDFEIKFRSLTSSQIDEYLDADQPFDCAGSIKVESLGISLLSDTRGRDINSLYGLPLMLLVDGLEQLDYQLKDFRVYR